MAEYALPGEDLIDKVFNRLEQILSTVKINPITPEVTAEAPTPTAAQTPAQ